MLGASTQNWRDLLLKPNELKLFLTCNISACSRHPELLWKTYIDYETSEGELERTRALYERLLERTKHYKVWVDFAKFEASAAEDKEEVEEADAIGREKECISRPIAIFNRANTYYTKSTPELKEERAALLDEWLNMETGFGTLGDVGVVQSKLPKKIKKMKPIRYTEYEEYFDYLFPEESQTTNLIEAAYTWKKLKVAASRDYD